MRKTPKKNIARDLFKKNRRDPWQEMEPPKSEFQKKVNLQMSFTKLLLMHPIDLNLSHEDYSSLGNLHAQVYMRD